MKKIEKQNLKIKNFVELKMILMKNEIMFVIAEKVILAWQHFVHIKN